MPIDPVRRPWNIIDVPVYSLATYKADDINMNICTYVTAVSRKPKQYAIALENGSRSLEIMNERVHCVLQLLTNDHIQLVRILGKRSGKTFDKKGYLLKNDELTTWHNFPVLKHCAAYLWLKKIDESEVGDHRLITFGLEKFTTRSEDNILMFSQLVKQRIIL